MMSTTHQALILLLFLLLERWIIRHGSGEQAYPFRTHTWLA